MLSEDECYAMWHTERDLVETIRFIYETGFNAGAIDKKAKKNGKQNVKQKPQTSKETEESF